MKNVIVIGRVRSTVIIEAISYAYKNVLYIASSEVTKYDFNEYKEYDLIFAMNPYKSSYDLKSIINHLKYFKFDSIFYLNTYVSDSYDRYQYMKHKEKEILMKSFDLISLQIPFIFTKKFDELYIREQLPGGFEAPYIYQNDLVESLKKSTHLESAIKFLKSYNLASNYNYFIILKKILWSNTLTKYKYINLLNKVIERIILRISAYNLSLCYLKIGSVE